MLTMYAVRQVRNTDEECIASMACCKTCVWKCRLRMLISSSVAGKDSGWKIKGIRCTGQVIPGIQNSQSYTHRQIGVQTLAETPLAVWYVAWTA